MNRLSTKTTPDAPEMALRIFISIWIILIGIAVFIFFTREKPKTKKMKPERIPPLVDVVRVKAEDREIIVPALGTVIAEQKVDLKAMVGGEIVMVSSEFIPGGLFKKGEVILKIDPADYRLDIKRKEAAASSAKATYDIEMGYQDVAREELTLMEVTSGNKIEESGLALRKPQLDQAQAQLDAAQADLESARLNLNRTIIKAPFNCMVSARSVNIGSQVSSQSVIATLIGTDNYWVSATVPVDQLKWLRIPMARSERGSSVKIKRRYQNGRFDLPFTGQVARLTGALTGQSRMGTLLVSVFDPLVLVTSVKRTPLILGSYVSLEIEGRTVHNTIVISRKALRDNDTVWLLKEGRLHIQKTEAFWKGEDEIYLNKGIEAGDALILSGLSSPVEGMKLTEKGAEPPRKRDKKDKPGAGKDKK